MAKDVSCAIHARSPASWRMTYHLAYNCDGLIVGFLEDSLKHPNDPYPIHAFIAMILRVCLPVRLGPLYEEKTAWSSILGEIVQAADIA